MVDAGTLATTAQVLLMTGENAGTNQILEANTNIAILWAESELYIDTSTDYVANYANATIVPANIKQALSLCVSSRAAWFLVNQDQDNWSLATSQSKLNVLDAIYKKNLKRIMEVDL